MAEQAAAVHVEEGAEQYATGGEYVQHHLGFLTYGKHPDGYELIPGWLYLCHVGNKGAAFSMLQGWGLALASLALVAIALIFFCRKSLQLKRPVFQWTFGLLIGGILGNFIDRVRLGHVTDFIDVHLPGYRWPAFNVADSAICVGVVLYLILSFKEPEPAKA